MDSYIERGWTAVPWMIIDDSRESVYIPAHDFHGCAVNDMAGSATRPHLGEETC